jgi:hypothetical protein
MNYIYNSDGCIMINEESKNILLHKKILVKKKGKKNKKDIIKINNNININFNDIHSLHQMHTY